MLYEHQLEFLNLIKQSIRNGNKRIMCVAPCGFGKSVIMKHICDSAKSKGNSSLVIVHRVELVNQLVERGLNVEMIQTLSRHLNTADDYKIIIIDEAQFFDDNLVNVCNELGNIGVRVIVAGLDIVF